MNKNIFEKLRNAQIERWVWCIAVAAFCWTDVAAYPHIRYQKDLLVWTFLAGFYAYKLGALKKENRLITLICTAAGVLVGIVFIFTDFWGKLIQFHYYNITLAMVAIPVLAQYALLIKGRVIQKQKIPRLSLAVLLAAMMVAWIQFDKSGEKGGWLGLLIILFPYACMELNAQRKEYIMNGIVDGLCLGFLVCQTYTFMFRPYFIKDGAVRFMAFRNWCTYAGMSYLQFYLGCILRYIIWKQKGSRPVLRKIFFVFAAAALAFLYMTGGRGPLLAAMVVTASIFFWIDRECSWKTTLMEWVKKCIVLAALSLALFPVAYAGTRYLPTIINKPDLQDSMGNRLYSFSTVVLKERFLYDGEFTDWSIKSGDPRDSIKYVTFKECLYDTLGRMIPGLDDVLEKLIADDVFEQKVKRIVYLFEREDISEEEFAKHLTDYCKTYNEEVPTEYKGIAEEYEKQRQEEVEKKLAAEYERLGDAALTAPRGETMANGWFKNNEYSSVELRMAIHMFALRRLGLFRCEIPYAMYERAGDDEVDVNAHNAFIEIGYSYGIPAMVLLIAIFAVMIYQSWKSSTKYNKAELLAPFAIFVAFAVFGWSESIFFYDNSFTTLILIFIFIWRSCLTCTEEA